MLSGFFLNEDMSLVRMKGLKVMMESKGQKEEERTSKRRRGRMKTGTKKEEGRPRLGHFLFASSKQEGRMK